jgi:hypothetical protein
MLPRLPMLLLGLGLLLSLELLCAVDGLISVLWFDLKCIALVYGGPTSRLALVVSLAQGMLTIVETQSAAQRLQFI